MEEESLPVGHSSSRHYLFPLPFPPFLPFFFARISFYVRTTVLHVAPSFQSQKERRKTDEKDPGVLKRKRKSFLPNLRCPLPLLSSVTLCLSSLSLSLSLSFVVSFGLFSVSDWR